MYHHDNFINDLWLQVTCKNQLSYCEAHVYCCTQPEFSKPMWLFLTWKACQNPFFLHFPQVTECTLEQLAEQFPALNYDATKELRNCLMYDGLPRHVCRLKLEEQWVVSRNLHRVLFWGQWCRGNKTAYLSVKQKDWQCDWGLTIRKHLTYLLSNTSGHFFFSYSCC